MPLFGKRQYLLTLDLSNKLNALNDKYYNRHQNFPLCADWFGAMYTIKF